ncbi:hypothetical protein SK128_021125 [Halocaridina rubra]|uniref:Uncharacterized protein n=1 Tax=Halocaridina rubra TaxID=373956 RepID=A0AAN8X7J5_HALRR
MSSSARSVRSEIISAIGYRSLHNTPELGLPPHLTPSAKLTRSPAVASVKQLRTPPAGGTGSRRGSTSSERLPPIFRHSSENPPLTAPPSSRGRTPLNKFPNGGGDSPNRRRFSRKSMGCSSVKSLRANDQNRRSRVSIQLDECRNEDELNDDEAAEGNRINEDTDTNKQNDKSEAKIGLGADEINAAAVHVIKEIENQVGEALAESDLVTSTVTDLVKNQIENKQDAPNIEKKVDETTDEAKALSETQKEKEDKEEVNDAKEESQVHEGHEDKTETGERQGTSEVNNVKETNVEAAESKESVVDIGEEKEGSDSVEVKDITALGTNENKAASDTNEDRAAPDTNENKTVEAEEDTLGADPKDNTEVQEPSEDGTKLPESIANVPKSKNILENGVIKTNPAPETVNKSRRESRKNEVPVRKRKRKTSDSGLKKQVSVGQPPENLTNNITQPVSQPSNIEELNGPQGSNPVSKQVDKKTAEQGGITCNEILSAYLDIPQNTPVKVRRVNKSTKASRGRRGSKIIKASDKKGSKWKNSDRPRSAGYLKTPALDNSGDGSDVSLRRQKSDSHRISLEVLLVPDTEDHDEQSESNPIREGFIPEKYNREVVTDSDSADEEEDSEMNKVRFVNHSCVHIPTYSINDRLVSDYCEFCDPNPQKKQKKVKRKIYKSASLGNLGPNNGLDEGRYNALMQEIQALLNEVQKQRDDFRNELRALAACIDTRHNQLESTVRRCACSSSKRRFKVIHLNDTT